MDAENKSFNLAVNHKYFSTSLLKILDLVGKKSVEIVDNYVASFEGGEQSETDYQKTNKYKAHMKIQATCNATQDGFLNKESNYDQGKIIKKIYKTITQNLDKFYPEPDVSLFQLRNNKNETVTIIPGLDIYQVVRDKLTTPEDTKTLWAYMYMMYISATNMIIEINQHKKEGKVWNLLPDMRKKIVEWGIEQDGVIFNPFVGLNIETGEYDVNDMYANVEDMPDPTGVSMDSMLKMSGMEKLFNMDQLKSQLNDIKPEDIEEATRNITKLIGAEDDEDINEICGDLVGNVIEELQKNQNGDFDIMGIAKSVADRVGGKMQKDKYQKTAKQFNNFMNNSQDKLKELKDENGNPIGEKLMNSLNMPMMMAQMMGGQGGIPGMQGQQGQPGPPGPPGMPDMAALMQMMGGMQPGLQSHQPVSNRPRTAPGGKRSQQAKKK